MATPPPAPFTNGRAPLGWFVTLKSGKYTGVIPAGEVGYWAQLLTPAMLDFHNRLVARARARTGRTLQLSDGYSAYRPIEDQRRAKRIYGNGAAGIGESSHGLVFEGRYAAAFDYGNWGSVYGNNRALFYADVRAEGGVAGYFDKARGTVDEPWHVIINDPFRLGVASATAGGGATDWDEMASKQEIKDAVFEVLRDTKLGPGNRNHWDSLNFIAGVTNDTGTRVINALKDQTVESQAIKDAVIGALTDWRVFDQDRNVFDQLKFLASQGVTVEPGSLVIDLGAIAKAVNDEAAKRLTS